MVRAVVLLNGAALCGLAAASRLDLQVDEAARTRGSCKESHVSAQCECNHWSWGNFGHLCSGCKDNKKWGVGCDLSCPEECTEGCDFGGNCLITQNCPDNCKAGDRADSDQCLNARYECNECKDGYFGKKCESQCPGNCGESAEGKCTRGGKCFRCKEGFYGEDCSLSCPTACPDCVMRDNLIPDPSDKTTFLKAGMCKKQCKGNVWGPTCEEPCPEHCKPPSHKKTSSCDRTSGACKSCDKNAWYGDKCETTCSDGCDNGKCEQDGTCTGSCKKGFWGDKCDQACPTGASSCEREDGMPLDCGDHSFPSRDENGKGFCEPCPENCKEGTCHKNGFCSAGCKLGFHGDKCDKKCSESCDGPCDAFTTKKSDGHCLACQDGFTGPKCGKMCHLTCRTCKQTVGQVFGERAGDTESDCLSCRGDDAAQLGERGTCDCIPNSKRSGEKQMCQCNAADNERLEAFMEVMGPYKQCGHRCSTKFQGHTLKKVHDLVNDKTRCISAKLYNKIIRTANEAVELEDLRKTFSKGSSCQEGEFEFDDDLDKCLHEQFVKYVVTV